MASIEIGLDAYNGMLERIKDLEIKNVALELETKKKDATISDLQEKIDIVKNANWYDRIISWKQIISLISESE